MNVAQYNALRKLASGYEQAESLEKEASFKRQLFRNVIKGKHALKSAGGAVADAFNRTKTAFNKGGLQGGLTSLKRQGQQAGTALATKWNGLSSGAKAGILAGGGALAGATAAGMMSGGNDDWEAGR